MVDNTMNSNTKHQHEPDSIWSRSLAAIGIGLLLLVIVTLFGVGLAFKIFFPQKPPINAADAWSRQPAPGVQPNQAYDYEQLLAEEKTFLGQYAWQDKDRGIARIPIERGIEIMAERKLHVSWPAEQPVDPTNKEAK